MLEQVYREQLDGIIFSINQYGADLLDFYTQQIDYTYIQGGIEPLMQPNAIKGNLAIEFSFIKGNGRNLLDRSQKFPLQIKCKQYQHFPQFGKTILH